jgi:hypothetical protein
MRQQSHVLLADNEQLQRDNRLLQKQKEQLQAKVGCCAAGRCCMGQPLAENEGVKMQVAAKLRLRSNSSQYPAAGTAGNPCHLGAPAGVPCHNPWTQLSSMQHLCLVFEHGMVSCSCLFCLTMQCVSFKC